MEIVINFPTSLEHKIDEAVKNMANLESSFEYMYLLYKQKTGNIFDCEKYCDLTGTKFDPAVSDFFDNFYHCKEFLQTVKYAIRNSYYGNQDYAVLRMSESENTLLYYSTRFVEKPETKDMIIAMTHELEALPDYVERPSFLANLYLKYFGEKNDR